MVVETTERVANCACWEKSFIDKFSLPKRIVIIFEDFRNQFCTWWKLRKNDSRRDPFWMNRVV
ncbi:hypothetical protein A4G99_16550 [Haladaptatus sp. R4]|nr:hypothetical protein A4G99_16550 [Haladaptatus sp. R4]